jgi:death-on-curing protein
MKEPIWVLREVVLIAHEQSLAEFGGAAETRDEGLLDSALNKPENLFAYGTPSVFQLAASYGFGLVKNHSFIDGNKRIGLKQRKCLQIRTLKWWLGTESNRRIVFPGIFSL